MMLRFGIELDNDFHNTGQTPISLHLSDLKDVMFSYPFTSKGLVVSQYLCNHSCQDPLLEW